MDFRIDLMVEQSIQRVMNQFLTPSSSGDGLKFELAHFLEKTTKKGSGNNRVKVHIRFW